MSVDLSSPSVRRQAFRDGVRAALGAPAAVLFAGMVGFGALGQASQIDWWLITVSSWTVMALPGQVVLVEMLASGASLWAILLAVTLTSTRFITMVVTLFAQFDKRERSPRLYAMVHLVAMTAWALSMRDFQDMPRERRAPYFFGMAVVCWSVTLPATVIGYFLASRVSPPITLALVLINPLFFLLTFTEVRPWANRLAIVFGCVLGPMLYLWDKDTSLLLTGLIAGTAAYWIDRRWIRGSRGVGSRT